MKNNNLLISLLPHNVNFTKFNECYRNDTKIKNETYLFKTKRSISDSHFEERKHKILSKKIYLKIIPTVSFGNIKEFTQIGKESKTKTQNSFQKFTRNKVKPGKWNLKSVFMKTKVNTFLCDSVSTFSTTETKRKVAHQRNKTSFYGGNILKMEPIALTEKPVIKQEGKSTPELKHKITRKITRRNKLGSKSQQSLPLLKRMTTKIIPETCIKEFLGRTQKNPTYPESSQPDHTFFIEQTVLGIENFYFFGLLEGKGKDGYHLACVAKANFIYYFTSEFAYYPQVPHPSQKNVAYIYNKLKEHYIF